MVTISVCMIVKNEEAVLARCLACAKQFADEIIVVDTGSTDRTKEIASEYTEHILDFPWRDDFAAARNFSFDQASMDYCMWLDADDVVKPQDIEKLRILKKTLDPQIDVVMMQYHAAFDEMGNPSFSYYRERLLRREAGFRFHGAVHEVITPSGQIVYEDIAITHQKIGSGDPERNLRIFEKLLADGISLEPRQQFYYARELMYLAEYRQAVDALKQFLLDGNGWVENNIEACRQLAFCYTALQEETSAMAALLHSFIYDSPRAEICCDLGQHFFNQGKLTQAIYWYQRALDCHRNDTSGGFVLPDCYDYIPYLQLCVCYDRLGDYQAAAAYNEKAGLYKPHSPQVQSNRIYFQLKFADGTK